MYSVNKLSNSYADVVPNEVFEGVPKAVWAAIAVSFATSGGDGLNSVTNEVKVRVARMIVGEWAILHQNGIVPQALPASLRKYNVDGS